MDNLNSLKLSKKIRGNPLLFAEEFLGISVHKGQEKWVRAATRLINILRPGNKWGKTLIEAVIHIWHAVCKPKLKAKSESAWLRSRYQTLVFGPTYEQSRELLSMIVDLVQGNLLLPDGTTNKSQLKDWAITEDRSGAVLLPNIRWFNNASTLGRSYDEMGKAFKMKSLAFITGDECADITELWTFTNNTLLPRLTMFNGIIHFSGTPQPGGIDYNRMIKMAEEDMAKKDWKEQGMWYTQKGSLYENEFAPKDYIEKMERIADPELKKQIIYGEIVEIGEKYFGFTRIHNALDRNLQLLDHALPGRSYITAYDPAGGESVWADYSVCMTVDYTTEPYQVVHFWRVKGAKDVPIPMQYAKVKDIVTKFQSRLIVDTGSLGGKNAKVFLRELHPICFEGVRSKGEMLDALKTAFDGGQSKERRRMLKINKKGKQVEVHLDWGLIRFPDIPQLYAELMNYRIEDKKIHQDCVMALGMAIWWIELRRPKIPRNRAEDFDLLAPSQSEWSKGFFPYQRQNKARGY